MAIIKSVVVIFDSLFICLFLEFDMKKDIDALIEEERAEVISKYDKVSRSIGIQSL